MAVMDYKYSLDFLEKINHSVFEGKLDTRGVFYEGYNIWYFFQASLFVDIKKFSLSKEIPPENRLSISGFLVSLFFLFFSLCSLFFLSLTRKRVMIFSVDSLSSKFKSDYRMESLYSFLETKDIDFFEVFHTIPSKTTMFRLFKRSRLTMYLESIDFMFFIKQKIVSFFSLPNKDNDFVDLLQLNDFSDKEKLFAAYCIGKYFKAVPISLFRIKMLKKIIKFLKVKTILTIDDTRHYNELLVAAKLCGVLTIAFQHGHYTGYHVGCLRQGIPDNPVSSTVLCVWSEYWKKELQRLNSFFPSSSIFVTGPTFDAVQIQKKSLQTKINNKKDTVCVLIPYETDAPKNEARLFIHELLRYPNVKIIFKTRPNRDKQSQLDEYGIQDGRVEVVRSLSDVIADVDVVLGVYSTILYDMVALEKHVYIMDTGMDYGQGMIINGLADRLYLRDIKKAISAHSASGEMLKDRKEKVVGTNPQQVATSLEVLFKKYQII
ncbi:MAG: hypothetical protein AAB660_00855 [Patescibacteria group bacterium]